MTLHDPHVIDRCAEIEGLLTEAAVWASQDAKLGAHLAAYITVLITGLLEDCIEYLVVQRVGKTQDSEVQNYVKAVIKERFRNPDWGAISGLLGQFSDNYKHEFGSKIRHDGSEADALNSIVTNKNSLAHIGTANLQVTVGNVDDYFRRIIPILEVVEQILR